MTIPAHGMPNGTAFTDLSISPIARDTLAGRVSQALQQYVADHNLRTGDRLPPERALSRSFEVSVPIVREALRSLEALGVLRIHHGRGIFVDRPVSAGQAGTTHFLQDASTAELATARIAFEMGIVDVVCARRTEEDCDALTAIVMPGGDAAFTVHTDLEFHLRLLAVSRNRVLEAIGERLLRQFFRVTAINRPSLALSGHSDAGTAYQRDKHHAIVESLRKVEVESMRSQILHHLDDQSGFRAW
jgi:GntR family transcriptional repressor for pyruvate dehydrogenase complex